MYVCTKIYWLALPPKHCMDSIELDAETAPYLSTPAAVVYIVHVKCNPGAERVH